MNIYIIIVLGLIGIIIGYMIPAISSQLINYKNRKRNREPLISNNPVLYRILLVLLNGFLWAYTGSRTENTLIALLICLLFTITIIITIVDIRIRIIPNELVLLMFCLGLVFQILYFGWKALPSALACMLIVGFIFIIVGNFVGLQQIGAGDVKLAAVMGLTLGYPAIAIALVAMSAILIIYCLGGLIIKKLHRYSTFPFAPFLMFGNICGLLAIILHY